MDSTVLTKEANRIGRDYWQRQPLLTKLLGTAQFACGGSVAPDGQPWQHFAIGEAFSVVKSTAPDPVRVQGILEMLVYDFSDELPDLLGVTDQGHLALLSDDLFTVEFARAFPGGTDGEDSYLIQVSFYGAFVRRPNTTDLHPPGPAEAYR